MYLDYYSLREHPFQNTPNPEFLFFSPSHKAALRTLIHGIEERKGFIAILGAPGIGKTTILRYFLDKINPEKIKAISLFHPMTSLTSLTKTLYQELGLSPTHESISDPIPLLYQTLMREYEAGRYVALLIDNAHTLSPEILANLWRFLQKLESETGKLLQVVFVGQPELEQRLRHPLLQSFPHPLISLQTFLDPLTPQQSIAYIQYRLGRVMTRRGEIFAPRALHRIVKHAQGVPLMLNILCDNALRAGYEARQRPITPKTVKRTIVQMKGKRKPLVLRWGIVGVSSILLLGGFLRVFPHQSFTAEFNELRLADLSQMFSRKLYSLIETKSAENPSLPPSPSSPPLSPLETTAPDKTLPELSKMKRTTSDLQEQRLWVPLVSGNSSPFSPDSPEKLFYTRPSTMETPPTVPNKESKSSNAPLFTEQRNLCAPGAPSESGALSTSPLTEDEPSQVPLPPIVRERLKKALIEKLLGIPEQSSLQTPLIHVVQEEEQLISLIFEVYGQAREELILWVKEHNPHLQHTDTVPEGERIIFPALPEELKTSTTTNTTRDKD